MTSDYSSHLTPDQWDLLVPLLPGSKATGRPRTVDLYAVVNAILYLLTTGCAWALLPQGFPPYSTVYYYFRQWKNDGTWKRVHDHRVAWVRVAEDRDPTPSAGALDDNRLLESPSDSPSPTTPVVADATRNGPSEHRSSIGGTR